MDYSVSDKDIIDTEIRFLPTGVDPPIPSSDSSPTELQESGGRRCIKRSCDKHIAYCQDMNVDVWDMRIWHMHILLVVHWSPDFDATI